MAGKKQKKFKMRGFTTFVVTISFLLMLFSGLILYLSPAGSIARWTAWTIWSLDKWQWEAVHTNTSILFLLVTVCHLFFNWKIFINYFKTKIEEGFQLKRELILALVVGGVFVAGTIWNIQPFKKVTEVREDLKYSQKHLDDTLPFEPGRGQGLGRARISTVEPEEKNSDRRHRDDLQLDQLARQRGLTPESLLEVLRARGIKVTDSTVTVAELAEQNGLLPDVIYEAARVGYGRSGSSPGRFSGGRGLARMTLGQYCKTYGLETKTVIAKLNRLGIQATERSEIRRLAFEFGTTPGHFPEVLQQAP